MYLAMFYYNKKNIPSDKHMHSFPEQFDEGWISYQGKSHFLY